MRKEIFVGDEYYHIYNRGVDKRTIFEDYKDIERFFNIMGEFNVVEPSGGFGRKKQIQHRVLKKSEDDKLVEFITYCLNPNHFHFILRQLSEGGISKFMHKIGMGYSKYFNVKYDRKGSLFQGQFKAKLVDSDKYLMHLSAYVNLNNEVHNIQHRVLNIYKSSWDEYSGKDKNKFCNKSIILKRFEKKKDYEDFAKSSMVGILNKRLEMVELNDLFLE